MVFCCKLHFTYILFQESDIGATGQENDSRPARHAWNEPPSTVLPSVAAVPGSLGTNFKIAHHLLSRSENTEMVSFR